MTDTTATPPVSAKPATDWADVANNALHYAAGGLLLAAVGAFAWFGKGISPDAFLELALAAAAGIGIKMSK